MTVLRSGRAGQEGEEGGLWCIAHRDVLIKLSPKTAAAEAQPQHAMQ